MENQEDSGDYERKKTFRRCAQEVWDHSFRSEGRVKYEELLMEGPLQTLVANKLLVIETRQSNFSNAAEYRYLEKHFKEVVCTLAAEQLQWEQKQCLSSNGAEKLHSAQPSPASPQSRPTLPLPLTDRAVQQQSAEAFQSQRGRASASNLSAPRRSQSHASSATRTVNSTQQPRPQKPKEAAESARLANSDRDSSGMRSPHPLTDSFYGSRYSLLDSSFDSSAFLTPRNNGVDLPSGFTETVPSSRCSSALENRISQQDLTDPPTERDLELDNLQFDREESSPSPTESASSTSAHTPTYSTGRSGSDGNFRSYANSLQSSVSSRSLA